MGFDKSTISIIHYILTFILFAAILVNIINLTIATIDMKVNKNDQNAVTAKDIMISAEVITYSFLFMIIIFLMISYSYASYGGSEYKDKLLDKIGGENIFIAIRIIVFSILTFLSVVISALCLSAARYISISDNPEQYDEQYNLCDQIGKALLFRFIIFASIQGIVYIYQLFRS